MIYYIPTHSSLLISSICYKYYTL